MQLVKEERRKCRKCKKDFLTKTATRQCQVCQLFGKSTKKATARALTTQLKEKSSLSKCKKVKKPKEKSLKDLIKEVDKYHSIYVRKWYSKDKEKVECCTCKRVKPIKEMQCGHFISRTCMWLRFDMRNTFPQCVGCNIFKKGAYVEYTKFIIDTFGMNRLQNLLKEKDVIKKFTVKELQDLIEYYKNLK